MGWTGTNPLQQAARAADPPAITGVGQVYPKLVAGNVELFFEDAAGQVVQLTSGGYIAMPEIAGSFVTVSSEALPNERVLTGTANRVTVTDDGAGTTVTLSTPQDIHTGASPTFSSLTVSGGGVLAQPGRKAVNQLRLASDVISAETVTIGADVYEVEIVNTDTTDNTAGGEFNNTTDPVTVTAASYPNTTFTAGRLIRVENEIMRVATAGATPTLNRGVSGTTTAAHADALDIFQGDGIAGGSTIAVGLVATLTPAAFSVAIADDINTEATEAVTAASISANEVLLVADAVGAVTIACTEALLGANNGWSAANMYGGYAAAQKRLSVQTRVPTATEVALGSMWFSYDFTPVILDIKVAPTANPGGLISWDGSATISGTSIKLDNSASSDWSASDTIMIMVTEA